MSTEELETAYLDAMKRLKGSILGPQLAAPIEEYVKELQTTIKALDALIVSLHEILSVQKDNKL